jgi:hypothetical protein
LTSERPRERPNLPELRNPPLLSFTPFGIPNNMTKHLLVLQVHYDMPPHPDRVRVNRDMLRKRGLRRSPLAMPRYADRQAACPAARFTRSWNPAFRSALSTMSGSPDRNNFLPSPLEPMERDMIH